MNVVKLADIIQKRHSQTQYISKDVLNMIRLCGNIVVHKIRYLRFYHWCHNHVKRRLVGVIKLTDIIQKRHSQAQYISNDVVIIIRLCSNTDVH